MKEFVENYVILDKLKMVEEDYNCAGVCEKSLFYVSRDFNF